MGDNRANSSDSRYQSLGFVDEDDIDGKVFFRLWPLSKIGFVE
jgi:signal peptidase I